MKIDPYDVRGAHASQMGGPDSQNRLQDGIHILRNISMLGQLGLSLIMPVLLCMFACSYLSRRFGIWVYIPGFILGIGAGFMTAYKVYLSVIRKNTSKQSRDGIGFNQHL